MTLDELRNINFNDLASWPAPIKIAAIGILSIAIMAAG